MSKNDTAIATVLCDTTVNHTSSAGKAKQIDSNATIKHNGGGGVVGGVSGECVNSITNQYNNKYIGNTGVAISGGSGTGSGSKIYHTNNNNNNNNTNQSNNNDVNINMETKKAATVIVNHNQMNGGDATNNIAPTTSINNVIFNKSLDTTMTMASTITSTSTMVTLTPSSTPPPTTTITNNNNSSSGSHHISNNNGCWRDYKKLKTYLILKDKQNEKVIEIKINNNKKSCVGRQCAE